MIEFFLFYVTLHPPPLALRLFDQIFCYGARGIREIWDLNKERTHDIWKQTVTTINGAGRCVTAHISAGAKPRQRTVEAIILSESRAKVLSAESSYKLFHERDRTEIHTKSTHLRQNWAT